MIKQSPYYKITQRVVYIYDVLNMDSENLPESKWLCFSEEREFFKLIMHETEEERVKRGS